MQVSGALGEANCGHRCAVYACGFAIDAGIMLGLLQRMFQAACWCKSSCSIGKLRPIPYFTLPHCALLYLTVRRITLPYFTLPYITLPYSTLP